MKLALVADWLTTFGGAEHVLAELHEMYPDAPFFTTVAGKQSLGPLYHADIRTTSLQYLYNITNNHQVLLGFMPKAIESIDLTGYDIILSSSHAVGKGIIPPSNSLHICYCHTPIRYAWEMEEQYLHDFNIPNFLKGLIRRELKKIRRWDLTTAKRVDLFIANSTTTQERINRMYGRESVLIPPPVEERFFMATGNELRTTSNSTARNPEHGAQSYYLAVSRLVPYKRLNLVIELANKLNLPLKIAGKGQDAERLKKLAGPTIEFLGFVPDEELPGLYAGAKAFFFPQYEDAGIVALEAQAAGTPVIAYGKGGALDAVLDGQTGILFEDQTVESMEKALRRFEQQKWNTRAIITHARSFSETEFRQKIKEYIENAYKTWKEDPEKIRQMP